MSITKYIITIYFPNGQDVWREYESKHSLSIHQGDLFSGRGSQDREFTSRTFQVTGVMHEIFQNDSAETYTLQTSVYIKEMISVSQDQS